MHKALWKTLGRHLVWGASLLGVAHVVSAQQPQVAPAVVRSTPELPPIVPVSGQVEAAKGVLPVSTNAADELKARIDRLERQNQELMELLKAMQNRPALPTSPPAPTELEPSAGALSKQDVQKMVSEYLASQDASKAAGAPESKSFVVGQNLGLKGVWTTGPGSGGYQPWFETEDKSFRVHFGGRFQPDFVLGAGSDDNVAYGLGGTGPFREGFNFRRARLEADGWLGEVVDFFMEFDFVNNFSTGQPVTLENGKTKVSSPNEGNIFNPVVPTDLWAGINYIPYIGGIRVGNIKPAIGLDHLTSSRYLDFMERSLGFDTYYNRENGFAPGFMIFNYTENQRAAWQLSATKNNNGLFGWNVGGGDWSYCGRFTFLPYYEDNGRRMIHLGVGGKYGSRLDQDFANLVGRWLLRNGPANMQNQVAGLRLYGLDQEIINPELFINLGPLSIQSEYIASRVNGVTRYSNQLTGLGSPVAISSRTFHSQAAYVQALYFLTGESRPYGKTALHGSGAAPTRVVPFRNYFWVPGHGGAGNPFSAGAWQVGARYCWNDLNDNGINGGIVNEVTLGLNWFLNPNLKFQWNLDGGHRSLPGGTSDGNYYGFGMRMAFDF